MVFVVHYIKGYGFLPSKCSMTGSTYSTQLRKIYSNNLTSSDIDYKNIFVL